MPSPTRPPLLLSRQTQILLHAARATANSWRPMTAQADSTWRLGSPRLGALLTRRGVGEGRGVRGVRGGLDHLAGGQGEGQARRPARGLRGQLLALSCEGREEHGLLCRGDRGDGQLCLASPQQPTAKAAPAQTWSSPCRQHWPWAGVGSRPTVTGGLGGKPLKCAGGEYISGVGWGLLAAPKISESF